MFAFLKDIGALVFPTVCPACGRVAEGRAGVVCTACQWEMPLTGHEREADNPVARRFDGLVPIHRAAAMMWFADDGGPRRMVHAFKYGGRWRLALDLGRWLGRLLAESGEYGDVDVVVPVPLHRLKVMRRGYNQSEYIARGVAESMGVATETGAVVRRVNNPSQTATPNAAVRWENVEGIFAVRRPERLEGRRILLVDDVMTTGATVGSCAEAVARAVPSARISIAVLCASRGGLGITE